MAQSLSSLQKLQFLKLIISFLQIFGAKIEISGTKRVEKTPIYIFSTFGSKINKFGRKKLEKNRKNSKNLKVAGDCSYTLVIQFFSHEK
jgi:hypothetical protein